MPLRLAPAKLAPVNHKAQMLVMLTSLLDLAEAVLFGMNLLLCWLTAAGLSQVDCGFSVCQSLTDALTTKQPGECLNSDNCIV